MKEIWKDISGYEGLYQVSNCGRVKSLNYMRTGEIVIMRPRVHTGGYLRVGLCKYNKPKDHYIHRLVLTAFVPNPLNKPQVNHIDEIKNNNYVYNLEWVTQKENNHHGTFQERRRNTMKHIGLKPVRQLTLDGKLVKIWPSIISTKIDGFNRCNISSCCTGNAKTHRGFRWEHVKN